MCFSNSRGNSDSLPVGDTTVVALVARFGAEGPSNWRNVPTVQHLHQVGQSIVDNFLIEIKIAGVRSTEVLIINVVDRVVVASPAHVHDCSCPEDSIRWNERA